MRELLAADLHALDQAGEDVGGVLDRIASADRRRAARTASAARGIACVLSRKPTSTRGLAEARLAEQALLQRAGVEGGPLDRRCRSSALQALVMSPPCAPVATVCMTRWAKTLQRRRLRAGRREREHRRSSAGDERRRGAAYGRVPVLWLMCLLPPVVVARSPRWRLRPLRNACSWPRSAASGVAGADGVDDARHGAR